MGENVIQAVELTPDQLAGLDKEALISIVLELQQKVPRPQVTYNKWGFRVFSPEMRQKMRLAKLGNQSGAKPYPAFRNRETGEVIPAGVNLARMCRERGLVRPGMQGVKMGRERAYKGWELAEGGQ